MSTNKQQQNGALGESLSRSLLLEDFWVLTRSIDIDGADLIVQDRFESPADILKARGQPLQIASVQAKFFEGNNQVNLPKHHVHDENGLVRKGFVVILHTRDKKRRPVHYIFNSHEVADEWKETEDEQDYFFSLKAGRTYDAFFDLDPDQIRDKVKAAIAESTVQSMAYVWNKSAELYSSARSPETLNPKYRFLKIQGAAVAIFNGSATQIAHPIEPRKDIYNQFGTFQWGYSGEGPKLLAASVLAHFLCGRRPTEDEIHKFTEQYLFYMKEGDFTFGKEEIFQALAGIPQYCDLDSEAEALLRKPYEECAAAYGHLE